MFSQDEIDQVIAGAKQAVDDLAQDVDGLAVVADRLSGPGQPDVSVAEAPRRSEVSVLKPPLRGPARVLGIKVPVIVRLAERAMPLAEVLKIAPGMIIEFEKAVDAEIDLLANNHSIGAGVAVKTSEHYGIQLTRIGTIGERIGLLGRR